ncbi:hypothetical protein [uncultured Dokdonia sp.]|uniref:hypothetical protein n=1 Tax=uncultured Dokdonia sp. TaxID=575653 RepID=UPI0026080705|nr:hypothetical protein [uncultured Dokdonia sp.]
MIKSCKRCVKRAYQIPEFTIEEKKLLTALKIDHKFLEAIDKIRTLYSVELIDAKFSVMHINTIYGKCNRCNADYLNGEYVECPKCKSLNFNWEIKNE